jgi:lipopolysaccharide export LptBFGC system permease protein LptF
MKTQRYNIWIILAIILLCVFAVLFFPLASDNGEIYKAIIYMSIGIVLLLLFFLIKVHVFETDK